MAKAIKKCKVCGKEYEYCHTQRRVAGVFRWQDVACSPECGQKYLAAILESRGKTQPTESTDEVTETTAALNVEVVAEETEPNVDGSNKVQEFEEDDSEDEDLDESDTEDEEMDNEEESDE